MLPELVTKKDTVPCGTVAWSALKRIPPPFIMPLPWPIMPLLWAVIGPPIFVSATFTTVPGSLGAAREEPDRNPLPPGCTPPRRLDGPEDGPMTPTATAAEATRAITAVANAPTITGRLMALISCRPGRSGWRPFGPAMAQRRSARWPGDGRGSPAPTHPYCGSSRCRFRAADAPPVSYTH